ncbi:dienelactone hydrolase family protein [Rhizobium leguminosarum]|uniref:dienelactone hydrolase family protein n=1 Tax=Rhizobium leguminosarum TaxID=384 RepID=UPI001C9110D7|nr:dienelactone hydrolase family protein [Rhizobium leguminosarum]MBY2924698.1 dienelactone hydrolase family protein [Rhizobium leguminosarum]
MQITKLAFGLLLIAIVQPNRAAHADELVRFDSAVAKPSPFLERKAKEQGVSLPQAAQATHLLGYLSRPEGDGPFPAVVVMHGCGGIQPNTKTYWPQRLTSWGYVVLVVDSFTTRNIDNTCERYLPDRVFDAYGALDFLSTYPFVDARRVGLMGFSVGGIATLEATKAEGSEQFMDRKFKAAVGYYPVCAPHEGDATVPTLILNGELDDWSPAERCRQRVSHLSGKGPPIELNVYPGAYHDFDSPYVAVAKTAFGHREEYNATAAEQSFGSVRAFLNKYLSK